MISSYEQRVLLWLQKELASYPLAGPDGKAILIEAIHLEQDKQENDDSVIFFRVASRPHCLFGFRLFAREPVAPGHEWKENEDLEGRDPMGHGTVIYGNRMEQLQAADMGLPKDCTSDGVTWI